MSDDRLETGIGSPSEASAPQDEVATQAAGETEPSIRGRSWQFPLIAMSLLAILAAVWHRTQSVAAEIDPSSSLQFAQERLAAGDLEAVAASLKDFAASEDSSPELLVPHRILVADYLAAFHAPLEQAVPAVSARVADAYGDAVSVGAGLSEQQVHRLAICEMNAGRVEAVIGYHFANFRLVKTVNQPPSPSSLQLKEMFVSINLLNPSR